MTIHFDKLSVGQEALSHEKKVSELLAKHVASLLGIINNYPTDWRDVYETASVRVAKTDE